MSFAKHSDNASLSAYFPVNGVSAALLQVSFLFILFIYF